jgi:hypothetical protein
MLQLSSLPGADLPQWLVPQYIARDDEEDGHHEKTGPEDSEERPLDDAPAAFNAIAV